MARRPSLIPDVVLQKPIGVIAPASAPRDPESTSLGIDYLHKLGFSVAQFRQDIKPHGYLAGDDKSRADELNHFLGRDDIDLIFCLRGGYGTLRILDHIDYEMARRHPKLLIGYSDITALQLALLEKSGWVSVSGPMVAVEFAGNQSSNQSAFWELLSASQGHNIVSPAGKDLCGWVDGQVEGSLIGGNLSLVASLVGTPYLPPLKGSILFLEDIGESAYQVDGMLAQLKLSGMLDELGGVLIGALTDSESPPGKPTLEMNEVLRHYFDGLGIPVADGLDYGHFPVKNAIPIGLRARFVVKDSLASLTLTEPLWPPFIATDSL